MTNARQFELLAMQSLLPGLTFAAEKAVELLNEARKALSMPLVSLMNPAEETVRSRRDRKAGRRGRPPGIRETEPRQKSVPVKKPKKQPMTPDQRRAVGDASRMRWATVREAGIKMKGSGSPTNADVARAQKIIAKRKKALAA